MIIITGGGTAGHTNPGIAVAEALVEAGVPRRDIHFVGGERGNEATLVADAGFSIDLLPGRGIQRKLTTENLGSVLGLLKGLVKGLAIVSKRKPDVVVCLGGYAAFAASAAAVLRRIPIVVTEQNARASAVNRLFGRWAKVCALPFPDTDLPNGVVTGNPIRAAILASVVDNDPIEARKRLVERRLPGHDASVLDGRVMLAVWAGSLGATRINKAVRELAERWADRDDLAIYHIVGRRDWDDFRQDPPVSAQDGLLYMTVEYEDHIADVLTGADLAVCRAGASTVSEIAVAGLPSVLVPLPIATRDHQRANAAELVAADAARLVDDADATADRLEEELEPIITDQDRRRRMAEAARSVARPAAAADVAKLVLDTGGLR
ncbi:MAG: UDP-N-acetylglucosamine--N-acetylmuramyl-(pentapeptide) pyrophosphoryl-undecaprenol N-acetylglucosamine transferase [Acidimicrobiia bacterium]|nr:UDP-N-acetylglucosamine--N-acetylmuramyl-(pentapeptide) pyrophosphoryl-undecaprenol N-acetylglucosamine transferase [Acidimicrobiia bacterium]